MNKDLIIKYISILLVLLFAGCSSAKMESFDAMESEKMVEKTATQELADEPSEDAMSQQMLSQEYLSAFELRTEQKLIDLADYIELMSNVKYDEAFRKQAEQMFINSFLDENANINFIFDTITNISALKKLSETSKIDSFDITITEIESKVPFRLQNDGSYKGKYTIHQEMNWYIDSKIHSKNIQLVADITVLKKQKQFGQKKKDVWEIKISKME